MQGAFITGAGSGFGHALARRLLRNGWRVVATDPDPDTLAPLSDHGPVTCLPLDVRDAARVGAARDLALADGPIDVVVNNGGFAIFGTQEEADLEAIRDLFDVNVLGVARVTQAFLPHLRQVGGAVVNLSSVAGRMAFTESGFYAATKHAVEALSEALFAECAPFGVRVVVVEPGSFDTNFLATAERLSRPRDPDSPYASLHDLWDRRKQHVLEPPQDPERVVDAIVAALDADLPFLRVPVGDDAERLIGLIDALTPDAWTRLNAWRAGGPPPPDLLSPTETLQALERGDTSPRLAATRAAFRAGFLDPWADDPVGRAALDALAG